MKQKSCKNCKWVGCRNYGKDMPACEKYIPDDKDVIVDEG